ncbi:hypothetical protein ACFQ0B_60150 [Nonomuraea thailandensis]
MAFGVREFELALLHRMRDVNAEKVEETLGLIGASRAELREAHAHWTRLAHAPRAPKGAAALRMALGPPPYRGRRAAGSLTCDVLRWPLPTWPGLAYEALAAPVASCGTSGSSGPPAPPRRPSPTWSPGGASWATSARASPTPCRSTARPRTTGRSISATTAGRIAPASCTGSSSAWNERPHACSEARPASGPAGTTGPRSSRGCEDREDLGGGRAPSAEGARPIGNAASAPASRSWGTPHGRGGREPGPVGRG